MNKKKIYIPQCASGQDDTLIVVPSSNSVQWPSLQSRCSILSYKLIKNIKFSKWYEITIEAIMSNLTFNKYLAKIFGNNF